MERWLLLFIVGAIGALFLPKVPELFYLLSLALSCFCLLFFVRLNKKILYLQAFLFGLCFILFAGHQYNTAFLTNNIAAQSLHSQDHIVQGKVTTLVNNSRDSLKFNLLIDVFNQQDIAHPFLVRLSFRKANMVLAQGDRVELRVKLKPAHGFANASSFSYQRWLLLQNIVASGYVKQSASNQVLEHQQSLRQQLYGSLNRAIEHPLKPLLLALAIGEKSHIDKSTWQVLQNTGTQHLIAISGLHLGLIASLGFYLMKYCLYLFPARLLSQRYLFLLPMLASLSIASFYAYLAGFSMPTMRALIMLLVYFGLRLMAIKLSTIRWLLLSVFFIILLEPFAILDTSLYLSLSAVMVIMYGFWRWQHLLTGRPKWQRMLLSLLLLQMSISVFLMPLTFLLFKQVSLLAPLANFIVVPFLSMTAIPITLLATLALLMYQPLSEGLLQLALSCLEFAYRFLAFLSQFDAFIIPFNPLTVVVVVLLAATVFLLSLRLFRRKTLWQLLATLSLSVILIDIGHRVYLQHSNSWQITAFDVGHGLAVLIEKQGKAILYDSGASFVSGFNFVESAIEPYLHEHRITTLDWFVVSHSDNDHAGGLPVVIDKQLAQRYMLNFSTPGQAILNNSKNCLAGDEFVWQKLTIKTLWPEQVVGKNNDDSCVLEISDGVHKVLLPGDISQQVEFKLLKKAKLSQVDILFTPHHGSKSSSSQAFINTVKPKYVVHSSGYLNRWQMPVTTVVDRYKSINATQFNTGEVGMVVFQLTGTNIKVQTYRNDLLPFWPWH
ncbi:DNA internalization-related competence protein ComEC/Rec2 [Thalassotalea sp. 42_200_T64]|nr:DNA internalization-related competence protein ComEC/Rec2 [Thalassotalea sp. 42_200_T64]